MPPLLRRKTFFGVLFLLIIIMVLVLIRPYISIILFSLTMVIVLRPIYSIIYDFKWVKWKGLATFLTIVAFVLIVAIPVTILLLLTVSQGKQLVDDITASGFVLEDFINNLITEIRRIEIFADYEFDRDAFSEDIREPLRNVASWLVSTVISIGASFPTLLINLFLFLGFLITLLPTTDEFIRREKDLIPLESPILDTYLTKIQLMIRSMFLGIFVLSFVQGLAMGVFYVLAGVPYAVFWAALSIAFSVLPLVGISLVALPMGIILILTGNVTSGIIVLVGFYGFVNWLDNLLRPKLVPKAAYLHPMLLILSVFGGLALSGLSGVIYGPVIMIIFVTTIDMYREFYASDREPEIEIVEETNPT
jgi:predicted PurR-regulated permease PerM